jgi:hypothetical protein
MEPALKPPGVILSKLIYDEPLSISAFEMNLRQYSKVLDGAAREAPSDAAPRLERLRMRLDDVAWDTEVATAARATHEHVIARIQRATVEQAAEVDTLRGEVAGAYTRPLLSST